MSQTQTAPDSALIATSPKSAAGNHAARVSRDGLWWVGFALLLAAGWWHTFAEMWLRWFPAWHTEGYTLSQRLSEGDSYYAHGPLVPLIAAFIAYTIHKRVGLPTRKTVSDTIFQKMVSDTVLGWALLAGSLGLHLLSVYARVTFVSGFSLIGVLAAMLLITGGFARLKAYALPLAFLLFMVPLPMNWIADLNFALKSVAGRGALAIAVNAFNVPAVQDGSFIHLSGRQVLIVENVCGGLRSLISLVCFASLFALVCRVRGGWRWLMLALAAPLAVGCNIVRIAALIVVADSHGVEKAAPGSAFHDLSGLLIFALALGVMFAVERAIMFAGRKLDRPWTDPRLLGYLDTIDRTPASPRVAPHAMLSVTLVAAAGLASFWAMQDATVARTDLAARAAPKTVTLAGMKFDSHDMMLDPRTLAILETEDYLYRRFAGDAQRFDLAVIFSANNRKGTHPPDVCLEGGGEQIVAKRTVAVDVPGVGVIHFRELHTQRTDRQTLYYYVYKCGDAYTPDFFTQQARIFLNSLTSRNTAGALIRFSTQVEGDDLAASRALLDDAAAALMVEIERSLP